jgi:hypothetical protein
MSRRRTWAAKNGDFIAIALISAFVTVLFYVVVMTGITPPRSAARFNFGFGPEMDCTPAGLEPVCVRKPSAR